MRHNWIAKFKHFDDYLLNCISKNYQVVNSDWSTIPRKSCEKALKYIETCALSDSVVGLKLPNLEKWDGVSYTTAKGMSWPISVRSPLYWWLPLWETHTYIPRPTDWQIFRGGGRNLKGGGCGRYSIRTKKWRFKTYRLTNKGTDSVWNRPEKKIENLEMSPPPLLSSAVATVQYWQYHRNIMQYRTTACIWHLISYHIRDYHMHHPNPKKTFHLS